ncbi:MAG: 1,4-dihydroxy-2-naphthoate octaprenyltransferase [Prevotellaceae bacterium]|jgi:1,4-dihydroxy-2-naphthoate octaprenyltransferase|nr:1,4-dihydroxy-2-naphthoate octaprenyltransferase [Prevotellaceae bacterium]
MSKIRYYIDSFRVRTLPLSASGIIVGSIIAMKDGYFSMSTFYSAILTAVSLQVLSNVANDMGDAAKGVDNENRLGPIRPLQAGHLTVKEYRIVLIVFLLLSVVFGLALIFSAFHSFLSLSAITMLVIGGLAIVASIKYTVGKRNYGYHGYGDVFVFLFFGPVGVLGSYFLMTFTLKWLLLLPAAAFGFLTTAVINLNNMRDIGNDGWCGKNTIPVRIGLPGAKVYHYLLIILAWICLSVYSIVEYEKITGWFYVLFLPLFAGHIRQVYYYGGWILDEQMVIFCLGIFSLALSFSISQLL